MWPMEWACHPFIESATALSDKIVDPTQTPPLHNSLNALQNKRRPPKNRQARKATRKDTRKPIQELLNREKYYNQSFI